MRTFDISIPLHPQMPVWPGDPTIQLTRISKIEEGASSNVTQISMTVHAGTHIDAPYHFLGGGNSDGRTITAKSSHRSSVRPSSPRRNRLNHC